MDEAHKEVSGPCPPFTAIKKRVGAMTNGHLKSSFADVVVDWSAGNPQKEGKLQPAGEHVDHCLSHTGVGLDLFLI